MPMKIQKEYQPGFKLSLQTNNQLLQRLNLRDKKISTGPKLPIQIPPAEAGAEIPHNDAIRVEHWDYLEYDIFSELFCLFCVGADVL